MCRAQSEWEDGGGGASEWGASELGDAPRSQQPSAWEDETEREQQPSAWEDEHEREKQPSAWEDDSLRENRKVSPFRAHSEWVTVDGGKDSNGGHAGGKASVQRDPSFHPSDWGDSGGGGGSAEVPPPTRPSEGPPASAAAAALRERFLVASLGAPELNKTAFKALVQALLAELEEEEEEEGDRRRGFASTNKPSEKDLDAAFEAADADKSGKVDWGEFAALYELVKAGAVAGLGKTTRSFFGRSTAASNKKASSFQQSFRDQKASAVVALGRAEIEAAAAATGKAPPRAKASVKKPPRRALSQTQRDAVAAVVRAHVAPRAPPFRVGDRVEASDDTGRWHLSVVTAVAGQGLAVEYCVDFLDVGGGMDELAADGVRPWVSLEAPATANGGGGGGNSDDESSDVDVGGEGGRRAAVALDPAGRTVRLKVKPGQSPAFLAAALKAK